MLASALAMQVVFNLPAGTGRLRNIFFQVASQTATYLGTQFSYDPPTITSVKGCAGDV